MASSAHLLPRSGRGGAKRGGRIRPHAQLPERI
jgi:hypothetical protein